MTRNELLQRIKQAAREKTTRLNLSGNHLTALPPEIGQLSNLSQLDLRGNQLTALPPEIGQLSNLSQLDLRANQLIALPAEIGQLSNLSQLVLMANQLTALPAEIGQLSNLSQLVLSWNQLMALPAEIGQLSNLSQLDLRVNQLTALSTEIGQLSNLSQLDLSWNQLTALPAEIGQLSNLSQLDLSWNQLIALPPEICQLSNLSQLNLRANQLTMLPLEIYQLSNLSQLDLRENQLKALPPEVVEQGLSAILTYLRESAQRQRQWLSKLMILGEGGVGKTSLLRALKGQPFQEQQSTTHGIAIDPLELPHPAESDVTMTLNAWDFGGQEIYHATHQFFLSNRSLFLLVWNARLGYEQGKLRYWLKTIRANAPESPILLVAAWTDEREADFPESELRQQFPQIVGVYSISNKTSAGIEALHKQIIQTAAQLPLMGEIWPETWLECATEVRQSKDQYWLPSQFWQQMQDCGVTEKGQPVLAKWLHELGDILFFQDNLELNDLVILQPQWVTEYISKVLEAEDVAQHLGIFSRRCMDELWHDLPLGLREHFLDLMEQFDLSYKIPDDPEDKSLVVERLDYEPPPYQRIWEAKRQEPHCKEISMKFQLSEILAGIPTWFIARQHRFTLNQHWRTGVLFGDDRYNPRHLSLLRVERDTLTNADYLRLVVRGPMPHSFFDVLREGLEFTLRRYPGLQVTRLIPCPDPLKEGCQHEFNYANLVKRLERNPPKHSIDCEQCLETISVTQLLFGLHPTTQTQVLARIDLLETNLETAMQEGFQELRELVQREFLRQFRREQQLPESYCPNLFALTPDDREFWNRDLESQRVNLQLYCQYPGEIHPTRHPGHCPMETDPSQGFYTIKVSRKWWGTMAPYLRRMIRAFKYAAPLVSPVLGAAVPELAKQVKSDVELMKALSDKLPDTSSDWIDGESKRLEAGRMEGERLTGSGLRALRHFLKEADPEECWGGLRRVLTPEGDYLWLCDKHAKVFYPK